MGASASHGIGEFRVPGMITTAVWSPDGRALAVGTQAGRVWELDLESGQWRSHLGVRDTFRGGTFACAALDWHPTAGLVAVHTDHQIRRQVIGRPTEW